MDIWKGNILTQWSLRIHGGAGSRIHTPSSQKPKFPDAQAPYIKWHSTVVLIFPHFGARYDRPTITNKLVDLIFFVAVKSCPTLCDLMDARLLCPPLSSGTCMYIFTCTYMYFIYTYKIYREYPGSPVVRTLHFHSGGYGVSPWLGYKESTVYIQPLNFRHQISIFSFQGDPDTAAFFISHSWWCFPTKRNTQKNK